MRKTWIRLTILSVITATLVTLVGCDEGTPPVKSTRQEEAVFDVGGLVELEIESSNGAIVVRGIEGAQDVHVLVTLHTRGDTLEEAEERLDKIVYHMTQEGETVRLRYRASEQASDVRRYSGVSFDVVVPAEAQVDAETSNGAITIEAVSGRLTLDTSNGSIEIRDVVGKVFADTSNGAIEVERVKGVLELDTSNGAIEMRDVEATVIADTSNGRIAFTGVLVGDSHLMKTSNGQIKVAIPMESSLTIDASTSSGTISTDLPLEGDTAGESWAAVLNPPATAVLTLRTSNGSIRIEGLP
jgi:hypothetical protein